MEDPGYASIESCSSQLLVCDGGQKGELGSRLPKTKCRIVDSMRKIGEKRLHPLLGQVINTDRDKQGQNRGVVKTLNGERKWAIL